MKKNLIISLSVLMLMSMFTGCQEQGSKTAEQAPQAPPTSETAPPMVGYKGTVIETMNSGGYTYVHVNTGQATLWAAANQFEVKVGDEVTVPQGLPMENYHSKTLDRTFDVVYFVSNIIVRGTGQPIKLLPPGDTGVSQGLPHPTPAVPAQIDLSGIEKPEGGKTIEEIFTGKAELSGKRIIVRGKVVKFSPAILGANWIHLQDGTGAEGANDLTITTSATAKVGDTVTASGVIELDKDFGAGYVYDVVIENAEVTVE